MRARNIEALVDIIIIEIIQIFAILAFLGFGLGRNVRNTFIGKVIYPNWEIKELYQSDVCFKI